MFYPLDDMKILKKNGVGLFCVAPTALGVRAVEVFYKGVVPLGLCMKVVLLR